MIVDVVPHHEFTEGEEPENSLLLHIPSLLFFQGIADNCKDERYVNSALVERQWIQSADCDVVVLTEKFHQRDVEKYLLVAGADIIASLLVDHLNRQKQEGCISGF